MRTSPFSFLLAPTNPRQPDAVGANDYSPLPLDRQAADTLLSWRLPVCGQLFSRPAVIHVHACSVATGNGGCPPGI